MQKPSAIQPRACVFLRFSEYDANMVINPVRPLRRKDRTADDGPAAAVLLGGLPGGGVPCNESHQDGPGRRGLLGRINLSGWRRDDGWGHGWASQEGW